MRIFVAHQNLPISKNYISSGHLIIWHLVISGCDQIVCPCWIPIYVCPRFFWFVFNNLVIIRFVWFTGEFDRCFEAVLSDIKSVDKTFSFLNCVSVSALLCTSELIMCQPLVVVFLFLSTISSKYSFTESQINAVSLHVGSWSFQQWIVEIVYSTAEQRRCCSAHLILDSVQVNLYHQHTRRFTMTCCRLHPVTVTILWWCSWLQARLAMEHILLAAAYGRPVTETGPRAYTSCSCLWSTSYWDWPQSVCFVQLLMVDQSLRLAPERMLRAAAYGRPVTETGPRAYALCSCLWLTSHWDWPQSVCFLQLLMVDQSLKLAPERMLPAAAYGWPVTETGPRAYASCSCLWSTSHWDWPQSVCFLQLLMVDQSLKLAPERMLPAAAYGWPVTETGPRAYALCSCLWSTSQWDALCSCLWSTSHWDWPQSVCFLQLLMVDQSLKLAPERMLPAAAYGWPVTETGPRAYASCSCLWLTSHWDWPQSVCFVQLLMVDQSVRCFVQLLMVDQSLRLAP